MGIQVAIKHHTRYEYERPINLGPQTIRLRPAPHTRSPIKGYSLRVQPENHFINWQQDPFGNYLARLVFPDKTDHFIIDVEVITEQITLNPFDFFLEAYAETVPFAYPPDLQKELSLYLEVTESGPLLQEWVARAKALQREHPRSVDFLVRLNQEVCHAIDYTIRLEPGVHSCEQTLTLGRGSCRDSGWLLVQILRHLGLAARFVSGYLVQLTADEAPVEGPAGPTEDFTDLHAWAEVYLPGAGWIGLDATSGLFAGEGHIPLACTPSPESAAPISGVLDQVKTEFFYENTVERIWERPRVTRPYSDAQWTRMTALGEEVDRRLAQQDMRLTMGGEPTFVSSLDMESPQWNEDADGPDKRRMGWDLALRLKAHFAPQGLIHQGQGKWYPGEPIPRWQYAIYWRKDGLPLWQSPQRLAAPHGEFTYDQDQAAALARELCTRLGISPAHAQAAYEDHYYYLWEAGNLPLGADPGTLNPKDSLSRQALAKLLEQGWSQPRGYVIPLQWDPYGQIWQSCVWPFTREKLYLIPGDSAMGVRLPLDRLSAQSYSEPEPASGNPDVPTIKTALCVEIREGRLYVFLPPLHDMASAYELIRSLEEAANELEQAIILEGYPLPYDSQLEKLVVAPDPGVIEVNVHPARTWAEMVDTYQTLFELAKQSRLGAEKFMIDGRHTGTGGGNHITLGGATPADSPFLRRPDLLRSFVSFWQNHPGLSYLFASTFVGPTSQAPRVDEGRPEILYELEIAFRELDRHPNPQPWLVDRLFRNLLIDMTGNTHRAEFCIDKLFNPDSQSGRLGIVEMRGFDMPPHVRMCLAQLLLIRSLAAAFWEKPYRHKLIDWGLELHDRFLIHHYVREDLQEVCDYLQAQGLDFDMEWLAPFFEFRFPVLGEVKLQGISLTLRAGIEPWHVLGEEMSNAGTARFVDSSLERLEVKVSGIRTERFQLLCNQHVVPLRPTAEPGVYVAAIRYKAWNPPSALHPTIEVDTPLVFDLYDQWNARTLGGCSYHVAHPGGRNYDTFPVNSYEAEARRATRFNEQNHSPQAHTPLTRQSAEAAVTRSVQPTGPRPYLQEPIVLQPYPAFPFTLDLRRIDKR
ncbi:MAG: transglutaminase family protein [Bacteroidetes bacterium]|nr:MAG: transglutaminase family protein [Bacteroidota bacterium]